MLDHNAISLEMQRLADAINLEEPWNSAEAAKLDSISVSG